MNTESNSTTTSDNSTLYQAIKDDKLDDIILLLKNRTSINDPILTTGPFAGFTALHLACMEDNLQLVHLLVEKFNADVNVVAEDGIQPIHLAIFFGACPKYRQLIDDPNIIQILVAANANVEAEIGQETFSKYVKDSESKWCPDFGDKMTLFTYAIIYGKKFLASALAKSNVNMKIKSLTNKTLLMYVSEKNLYSIPQKILDRAGEFTLNQEQRGLADYNDDTWDSQVSGIIKPLIEHGADINALINNDPATLLLNVASYNSCNYLLSDLLPYYTSTTHYKALYYNTPPLNKDFDERFYAHKLSDPYIVKTIRDKREQCTKEILKDLINRRTFGLPVPEEEKQLMDKLIQTDEEIRNFVEKYEREIKKKLKNNIIEFGDKCMTLYDLYAEVFDDRKLKLLLKYDTLLDALKEINKNRYNCYYRNKWFHIQISTRIIKARKRFELMEEFEKISQLAKRMALPYETILDIIEYLDNEDLDMFIKAFISP